MGFVLKPKDLNRISTFSWSKLLIIIKDSNCWSQLLIINADHNSWTEIVWTEFFGTVSAGLNWNGAESAGLNYLGLKYLGLSNSGLKCMGLSNSGLNCMGLSNSGLNYMGLNIFGLKFLGLKFSGLNFLGLNCLGLNCRDWNGRDCTVPQPVTSSQFRSDCVCTPGWGIMGPPWGPHSPPLRGWCIEFEKTPGWGIFSKKSPGLYGGFRDFCESMNTMKIPTKTYFAQKFPSICHVGSKNGWSAHSTNENK